MLPSCSAAAQNLEEQITSAISQVVREKATDAVTRVAEILASKSGKIPTPPLTDYLGTVGKTPLVTLKKILPADCKAARVLVKLEMQNPGGSLKDRIALNMIEEAEKAGKIKPGVSTLVDFTSGNTGIGEAMVAAAKGYKCIICMPQVPAMYERYMICRQFGADVHLLNPAAGPPAWFKYIDELCSKKDHLYINQVCAQRVALARVTASAYSLRVCSCLGNSGTLLLLEKRTAAEPPTRLAPPNGER